MATDPGLLATWDGMTKQSQARQPVPKARKKKKKASPRRDAGRPRGQPIADAVLTRTLEELAAFGIEHLNVDRIARAADVNKTSVYRRWPTRDALIAAALERVVLDVNVHIADSGSLRGDLLALAGFVASLLEQPLGRALARAALDDSAAPAVKAMAARQLEQQATGPMVDLIARARARGEWDLDAPLDLVPSVLAGALLHRALLERRPLSEPFIASVVDLLVRAVTPRATGP